MKVLGLGDSVIDCYRNQKICYPGGNAFNTAVNAARLHQDAHYLGTFADDIYGDFLKKVLKEEGVHFSQCMTKSGTTKQCIEDVDAGERHYICNNLGSSYVGPVQLSEEQIRYINDFDLVLTSCNAKIPEQIPLLKDHKGLLCYDFGEKEKYRDPSYIEPILKSIDLMQFSMSDLSQNDIEDFAARYKDNHLVLVTRGTKPALLFSGDSTAEYQGETVTPVDTMGAGDAYITALAVSLIQSGFQKGSILNEKQMMRSMKDAAEYAGKTVQEHGGFNHPYEGIRAVIFDMDGVLVDSEKAWLEMFENLVGEYGRNLSAEEAANLYGCSKRDEDRILGECLNLSCEEARSIKDRYSKEHMFEYSSILYEGAKDLLNRLKKRNYLLGLASSSEKPHVEKMIRECGFSDTFDTVIDSSMIAKAKPDPMIYQIALENLGVTADQALIVEDSIYGLTAAERAGIRAVQYWHKGQKQYDTMSVGRIQSLKELDQYLK